MIRIKPILKGGNSREEQIRSAVKLWGTQKRSQVGWSEGGIEG